MRPKKKVLEYFRQFTVNERLNYSCLFCDQNYTAKNVTRFAQHLVKNCGNCPIDIKSSLRKDGQEKQNSAVAAAAVEDPASVEMENMNEDTADDNTIHKAFAKAVYVTGMPLSIFEHPLWIQAFKLLKPDYKPPSRKVLSTTLLDDEYNEMKNIITKKIEKCNVLHLAVDGWTNVRKDSLLNIMVYTPAPFFHTSIDAQTNRHTAEYLAAKISETMEEIGSEKFLGIVSDNAANMKKCGKLLGDKYEKTTWTGCLAHTLNLLVGDVLKMPEVHEMFTTVISVAKCVLKSTLLSAEFKKMASDKSLNVTLLLPAKTRWGSYLHCLENFAKSKEILQTMAINENNRETIQKFKSELLEEDTWKKIDQHINLLKPIVKWTIKLEADACTIHLVRQALEEVENMLLGEVAGRIFSNDNLCSVLEKFQQRKQNCVKPIHLASVILDPKSQGASLNSEEHLDGCSFIMEYAETDAQIILKEVSDYKCRTGIFEKEFVWQIVENVEPYSWWQSLYPNSELGKVALKILSMPATSASVERSFSTFSHIHTNKRNRLLTERCIKICYISHNWKLLNQNTSKATNLTNRNSSVNLSSGDVSMNSFETDSLNSSFESESISDMLNYQFDD